MLKKALFLLTFLSIFVLGLTAVGSQSEDENSSDDGICGRSDKIREAILAKVSATACAEVGLTELGTIYTLNLTGLGSLKEGDFDGLVGLTELPLSGKGLTELPEGIFYDLSSLSYLELDNNGLNSLPAGVFDNLSNLQFLYLDNNNLDSLPDDVFDNLSGLYQLYLSDNNLDSLPDGIFENLTSLAILETEGNSFTCIPVNAFGSRTDDFSSIKRTHYSREVIVTCVPDGDVCDRTPVVRDAIIESLSAVACDEVELTDVVSLHLSSKGIDSLQAGDFDDLAGLKFLDISSNNLSLLPGGVFDDLFNLQRLDLSGNGLDSLPAGVFDSLNGLYRLNLSGNGLDSLPDGVFDGLTDRLTGLLYLDISGNSLDSLPDGVFDNLSSLRLLYFVGSDDLDSLPDGVFDSLSGLETLGFDGDSLDSLPDGVFDSLSRLSYLGFSVDNLSDLPDGVFDSLGGLEYLSFRGDSLTSLPDGVFDNLTGLKGLFIVSDSLTSLPADVFDSLVNLEGLGIVSSSLVALPSDVSDGKPNLDANKLYLYNNSLVSPEFDFFGRERVVPPVDDTRPEVSLVAPVAGTFNGTVNFSASSSDDFSGVELVEFGYGQAGGNVEWFSGSNVGEGVWNASLNISELQNDSYNLSVRSFDFAGNNASVMDVVEVVFDNPVNALSIPPEPVPEPVPVVKADEDDVDAQRDDRDYKRDDNGGGGNSKRDDRDDEREVSSSQHSGGPGQTRSVYKVPPNSTARFDFTLSESPVYLVSFNVSSSVRNARVTVSNDSEPPPDVSEDYNGSVYSYVTVNKSNVDDSVVSDVTINFNVDKDFVSDHNDSEDDVAFLRYIDDEWVETETRLISSAGSTYSYQASSYGFGYYAIVLKAAPSVEGEPSPVVVEPEVEELPEPEDVVPEGPERDWVFYTMIAAIGVIVLIGGMAVFVHMRPGRFSHEDVEDTDDAGEGFSNSLADDKK